MKERSIFLGNETPPVKCVVIPVHGESFVGYVERLDDSHVAIYEEPGPPNEAGRYTLPKKFVAIVFFSSIYPYPAKV